MAGFKTLALSNIELGVDQRVRIDLKLEVGALTESVTIEAVSAAPSDLVVRAGDDGQQRADPGDAAQRPEFREPHAHGAGRPARHSWRQHRRRRQPGLARVGVVLGQRPTRRATTTSCSTAWTTTRPGCRRSSSSRASTRSTSSSCRRHLLRRVRAVARRRRQPADQVGHQHAARQRLRVPPQRRVRRQQLLQQPSWAGQSRRSNRTSSAARSAARSSATRRSSSANIRGTGESGTDVPVDRAVRGDARGRLLRVESRDLRSADRQPFPGNIIPGDRIDCRGAQHPHAALSRAEHCRARAMRARDRRSTTT